MKRTVILLASVLAIAGCAISPSSVQPPAEADLARFVVVTVRNPSGVAIPRAGSTVRTYDVSPGYALAAATRVTVRSIATAHRLREVSGWPIGLLGVHCLVFELPPGADRDEVLDRLRRDPRVETTQPLQSFSALSTVSNDPYRSLQRNLDVMDVVGAHAWSRGEGVRIAIIDTGVDTAHPDLDGRVVQRRNFVDDGRGNAHDRHGTAVAGIIAAVENNRHGIVGVAPAARLYSLRACWPEAENPARALCNTLTLAKALAAAIEARIEIVNLSLAGPADSLLARLVHAGLRRGMVFVGATPPPGAGASFPTDIEGVIGVDASGNHSDAAATLFAPGNEVLTLAPAGRYDFMSGSSLAAASVSGGIALLLACDRNLRAEDAREILARSSRPVSTARGAAASVNLCAAVAAVIGGQACKE